jgi:hypothetical protein
MVLLGRSDRVREAGESEVSHLQRGKQVVHVAFHTYCSFHPAKLFKVIEHDNRALVKPEILDRVFDLAVLDVKCSVAGQPCQKQGLRINSADIPEPRYEDTLLCSFDELLKCFRATLHDGRVWSRHTLHFLFLRPVSRVGEVLDHSFFDP